MIWVQPTGTSICVRPRHTMRQTLQTKPSHTRVNNVSFEQTMPLGQSDLLMPTARWTTTNVRNHANKVVGECVWCVFDHLDHICTMSDPAKTDGAHVVDEEL